MCIMSDELINDFEQEYQFVICQGLRFKVEQDWHFKHEFQDRHLVDFLMLNEVVEEVVNFKNNPKCFIELSEIFFCKIMIGVVVLYVCFVDTIE